MRPGLLALLVLVGCHARGSAAPAAPPAPKTNCDAGDRPIATSTSCLQDDSVCYQLVDGTWCTGGSGSHGHW